MAEKEGATELKKELQRLVEAIVEEGDESDDYYNLEVTDYAIRTLFALRNLKSNQPQESAKSKGLYGLSEDCEGVPVEFRCPISGLLFKDPVVLASGQVGLA